MYRGVGPAPYFLPHSRADVSQNRAGSTVQRPLRPVTMPRVESKIYDGSTRYEYLFPKAGYRWSSAVWSFTVFWLLRRQAIGIKLVHRGRLLSRYPPGICPWNDLHAPCALCTKSAATAKTEKTTNSKVKRLTIEYRDLGIVPLGISHQYSAPELAWPCIYLGRPQDLGLARTALPKRKIRCEPAHSRTGL